MAVRRPLVQVGGRTRQLPAGDLIPASAIEGGGAGIRPTIRIIDQTGAIQRLYLDENLEIPLTLSDGTQSSVPTLGVVYG